LLTPQDIQIADARANGATIQQIANQIGKDKSTVSRQINNSPDVKAQIARIQARIMDKAADKAADNIIHAVESYQTKGIKKDPQLRDHGYKASILMAQGMGILPSHTQSSMIVNILNQGNMAISEDILKIIAGLPAKVDVPDLGIIDMEEVKE
jgi:hypothetical protein